MGSNNTLIIRHLPPNLTYEERGELLKYFGAIETKNLSSKLKRNTVLFARFKSETAASVALHQLHQLDVMGHYLTVEYARGVTDKAVTSIEKHSNSGKREKDEDTKENYSKYYQTFLHKLNIWNSSLNITQPPPPHLKYQYPPPNPEVLRNICCTLASVPKFYTQVLHLMNKLNLPCPFQSEPFPGADVILPPETLVKENSASEEEEESELESDSDGQKLQGEILPTKRVLPQKSRKVKRPKFIKPVPTITTAPIKTVKPEEVFEKVSCEPVQRKIELKLTGFSENEKTSDQTSQASGAFGLMFPVTKEVTDEVELHEIEKETEQDEQIALKSSTITAEELASNRISTRDQKHLSVFKNYQPGIPSCRLYIKNLSKQVNERDLHYIYRRYYISSEDEQSNMFNVQLMTEGRMKGQAFITLHNVKQAEIALKETNGYILKDKPLVVQFARSAKAK